MIVRNLKFVKGYVDIDYEPRSQRQLMEDRGGRLVSVGPKIASGGYKEIRKKVGFSTLRIKEQYHQDIVLNALSWACIDDLDFTFTRFKKVGNENFHVEPEPDKKGFIEVECPGRFEPELSTEDLHQLCEDYLLLYQRYPDYQNLIKPDFDGKLQFCLFDALIDIVIQNKKDVTVPDWAMRALEIKRSVK